MVFWVIYCSLVEIININYFENRKRSNLNALWSKIVKRTMSYKYMRYFVDETNK